LSLRVDGRDEELLRELSDERELLEEPDLLAESESLERPNFPEESVLLIGRLGDLPRLEEELRLSSVMRYLQC